MNWSEIVRMRALKEELVTETTMLVGVDRYDQAIADGLQALGNCERQAIFLRFWEALPIARVADRMEISWSAADGLIDSALQKLRHRIEIYHLAPRMDVQAQSQGALT